MSFSISDHQMRSLLSPPKNIAVVGLSPKPERPSNGVARYLLDKGYTVIPVNPGHQQILGLHCYPDLTSVPEGIDIVDIFRRIEDIPAVVDQAVAAGAGVVWMQLGLSHDGAARTAAQAGLEVVMDRCIKIEHARLFPGDR
jgi:predicted CoA-binding protein